MLTYTRSDKCNLFVLYIFLLSSTHDAIDQSKHKVYSVHCLMSNLTVSTELNRSCYYFHSKANDIRTSKAVSPVDVKLSPQADTAKYTPKPTLPQPTQRNTANTPATLEVSSGISHDKQTSDINNTNNQVKSSWEEPKKRFTQPNDVTVERHKKSCCVLM